MWRKHSSYYKFVSEVWHGLGGVLVEGHCFYCGACVPGSKVGEFEMSPSLSNYPDSRSFCFVVDCRLFLESTFLDEGFVDWNENNHY